MEEHLPSEITKEESLRTAGQRRINMTWELTQAFIAVLVTVATLTVAGVLTIRGDEGTASFLLLSNAFFLVIGFYFGRTNHSRPSDSRSAKPV